MEFIKLTDEKAQEAMKGLKENDGYCPCKISHEKKNKCICRDFNLKLQDPQFLGKCECGLYEKVSK